MHLTVCYPAPLDQECFERLRGLLDPAVSLRGPDGIAEAQVLIEGRPSPETLDAAVLLRAVIVPFAGVPEATLAAVRQRPHLALHNLHHNAAETAELAVALLLAAAKRVVPMDQSLRRFDWSPRYEPNGALCLDGRTAMILGHGHIGRRVGAACRALGMRVLATRRRLEFSIVVEDAEVFPALMLQALLPQADALMLTLPHTPESDGLIGPAELALLPEGALLVNVARAQIVGEQGLYEALRSGRLHSAGLDVWYRYPAPAPKPDATEANTAVPGFFQTSESARNTPPSSFPFHELDNVVLSPHRAGSSADTENRRAEHLARLLNAFAKGEPMPNRVDLEAGY